MGSILYTENYPRSQHKSTRLHIGKLNLVVQSCIQLCNRTQYNHAFPKETRRRPMQDTLLITRPGHLHKQQAADRPTLRTTIFN